MTGKPLDTQESASYFGRNIFDEPSIDEEELEENLPPPPPMFSESELAAAKEAAFEQGRQQGIAESKESRDQIVAKFMGFIAQNLQTLFESEKQREQTYETEAINLSHAIFQQLFPYYSENHGFDELINAIRDVLHKAEGQSNITIEVHPDLTEGVREHINNSSGLEATSPRIEIKDNPSLSHESCSVSWDNGGAIHNSTAIATAVKNILIGHGATEQPDEKTAKESPTETNMEEQQTQPDKHDIMEDVDTDQIGSYYYLVSQKDQKQEDQEESTILRCKQHYINREYSITMEREDTTS